MTTFELHVEISKETCDILEFPTLQEAWEEFINQIGNEQYDNYPCSADGGDGLMLKLYAVDVATKTLIMQYDNRYGTDNVSLMYGEENEAIIDKDDLMSIDF